MRDHTTIYMPIDVIDSHGRIIKTAKHVFIHYMSLQRFLGTIFQELALVFILLQTNIIRGKKKCNCSASVEALTGFIYSTIWHWKTAHSVETGTATRTNFTSILINLDKHIPAPVYMKYTLRQIATTVSVSLPLTCLNHEVLISLSFQGNILLPKQHNWST